MHDTCSKQRWVVQTGLCDVMVHQIKRWVVDSGTTRGRSSNGLNQHFLQPTDDVGKTSVGGPLCQAMQDDSVVGLVGGDWRGGGGRGRGGGRRRSGKGGDTIGVVEMTGAQASDVWCGKRILIVTFNAKRPTLFRWFGRRFFFFAVVVHGHGHGHGGCSCGGIGATSWFAFHNYVGFVGQGNRGVAIVYEKRTMPD